MSVSRCTGQSRRIPPAIRRFARAAGGAPAIESALILPVVVLFIAGFLDIMLLYTARETVTHATEAAARSGVRVNEARAGDSGRQDEAKAVFADTIIPLLIEEDCTGSPGDCLAVKEYASFSDLSDGGLDTNVDTTESTAQAYIADVSYNSFTPFASLGDGDGTIDLRLVIIKRGEPES